MRKKINGRVGIIFEANLASYFLRDTSLYGRELVAHNGVTKVKDGRLFDGSDDYIDAGTNNFGYTVQTIEAWIYPYVDTATNRSIVSNSTVTDYDYSLGIGTADKIIYVFKGSDGTPSVHTGNTVVDINKWYHIVGGFDGRSSFLYVNGKSDATPTDFSTTPPRIPNRNLWIGRLQNTYNFKGIIALVRIYNYVLSPQKILDNYLRGKRRQF